MLNNGKNAILILVVLFFIFPSFMINAESIATAQTNNIAQNNQQIDDVRSQSSSSKGQNITAWIKVLFCSLLIIGYVVHIGVVWKHSRDLGNPTNRSREPFGNYIANDWRDPTRWTFLLSTILLPIGLYFVSETFSSNGILSQVGRSSGGVIWQHLAYTFSMAVFIIMITLEISYIYNLLHDYWRKILTGALTLDFIAFLGYSLIGEPQQTYLEPAIFETMFLFLAGFASLISSFLTLYFTRTHERFFIGITSDFAVKSPEKTKEQQP